MLVPWHPLSRRFNWTIFAFSSSNLTKSKWNRGMLAKSYLCGIIATGFFTPTRQIQNVSRLLVRIIKFWKKIWVAHKLWFCVLALFMVKCQDIHQSEICTNNSIVRYHFRKKLFSALKKKASTLKVCCI